MAALGSTKTWLTNALAMTYAATTGAWVGIEEQRD
jgi:hypothetical protein